ncbi:MAG: hypothetical protein LBN22_03085 [Clostridiales Family XIII bacterium]|nr:hypothetical protein [Clostridiales Family XIII bacterium]
MDKLEKRISIFVSNKSMSIAVGHKGKNRAYLKKRYPDFSIQFIEDKDLKPMVLKLDVIGVTDVLYEE